MTASRRVAVPLDDAPPSTGVVVEGLTPLQRIVHDYLDRRLQPIPLRHGQKAPDITGWPSLRLTLDDIPRYFNGHEQNVGILLGEPSHGVIDVDLDCPETLALAPHFLPPTRLVFGRASKPRSHWFYRSARITKTDRFAIPGDAGGLPTTLVELRTTGHQTIVPPSTHPSGECIRWDENGEPVEIQAEVLQRQVTALAIAAALARHWPGQGNRHQAALAAAGVLARAGLDEATVTSIVTNAARVSGDEEWEQRGCDVASTYAAIARGDHVTGGPSLAELLLGDGEKIVGLLQRWSTLRGWLGVRVSDSAPAAGQPTLTDSGNALRFFQQHGDAVRYCHAWKSWLHYDGRRWKRDALGHVVELMKLTARSIYAEAAAEPDLVKRAELVKWARLSEGEPAIRRALILAQSVHRIAAEPSDLDRDPWLLNCLNGTLDMRALPIQFREHCRHDLITKMVAAAYEPTASHPLLNRFLVEALPDADNRVFAQRFVGSCLTGTTRDERLVFNRGPQGGGKTTILEAVSATLGDYAVAIDFATLLAKPASEGPRENIARLHGARLVTSAETADGERLAVAALKQLTGGDTLTAHYKFGHVFQFKPTHKLWIASNYRPKADATDDAFWSRLLELPFPVERKRGTPDCDPTIKETLTDPMQVGAAILAWAVEGWAQWMEHGLGEPPGVVAATLAYRRSQEPLTDFVAERCARDSHLSVRAGDLRAAYEEWARERGVKPIVGGEWTEALTRLGCTREKKVSGATWKGIAVLGMPVRTSV